MIEIRLDRRQAFYAFVGCMLLVSVAFVVGLIMGQRMQLIDLPGPPSLAVGEDRQRADERVPEVPLGVPEDEVAQPSQEPEDFTFYDTLNRPAIALEPARVRPVPREQVAALDAEPAGQPEPAAAEMPPAAPVPVVRAVPVEPVPQPTPRVEPVAARVEPVAPRAVPAAAIARSEPVEDPDSATRTVSRRVRRVGDAPRDNTVDEFGYFIVEAGRFTSYEEAEQVRSRIASQGRDAAVSLLGGNSERRFRVEVGSGFSRRSEAQSVANAVGGRVVQEG